MKKFILILLLQMLYKTSAKNKNLKYNYIKSINIEKEIKGKDNYFILFFDQIDGKTEDIYREFLLAKKFLKIEKNIDIEVFSVNNKISQRLEKKFKVYKVPKAKFFKDGKIYSFDGRFKIASIKAWVKKMFRKIIYESMEIKEKNDLEKLMGSGEDFFAVFSGDFNSKEFKVFEKIAKIKIVNCFRTDIDDLKRFFFNLEENFMMGKSEMKKLISEIGGSENVQNEEKNDNNLKNKNSKDNLKNLEKKENDVNLEKNKIDNLDKFTKYVRFQKNPFVFFIQKKIIENSYKFTIKKIIIDNYQNLKKSIRNFTKRNYLTDFSNILKSIDKSKNLKYLILLYKNENQKNASKFFDSIFKKHDFEYLFIDINNYKISMILNNFIFYQEESIFILEKKEEEINRYLFKIDFIKSSKIDELKNYQNFVEKYKLNKLEKYQKSFCEEKKKDSIFIPICTQIYKEVLNKKVPKLVFYFENKDRKYDYYIKNLNEIYPKLKNLIFYSFDAAQNEIDYKESHKMVFPYLKIFYGDLGDNKKGISFTGIKSTFNNFFQDFIDDEL